MYDHFRVLEHYTDLDFRRPSGLGWQYVVLHMCIDCFPLILCVFQCTVACTLKISVRVFRLQTLVVNL